MASRSSVVKVSVLADADQFNRTMKSADGAASRFSKGMDTAKFAVMALAGSQVVGAVVSFGKRMQDLATTAEGVETRFDTVFGSMAGSMARWVDDQNEAFGTSEVGLKNLAAGIGDLLVPLGFARDEAASMTQEVLLLANALSEWTSGQVSVEQASEAVRKALLGEREMLKELGVAISEADVKQALLAKGMGGLTGEALAQAKAQATLELITSKSADALTAYEDRAGSALAEQKLFTAALKDSEQTLADAFAPEIEFVQGLLTDFAADLAHTSGVLAGMRGETESTGSVLEGLWELGAPPGFHEDLRLSAEELKELGVFADGTKIRLSALAEGMDAARHSASGAGAEFDEEAKALDELASAGQRAADAVKALHDEQRAAIDPVFKLVNATRDYNDAVNERERLERDGKQGTEEWTDASLDSIDALNDLNEARDNFSSDKAFIQAFTAVASAAGLSADEIQRLIDTILAMDGLDLNVSTSNRPGGGLRVSADASGGTIRAFHDGGVVPGPVGMEQLALVKGGETILPTHKNGGRLMGEVNVIVNNPTTNDLNSDLQRALTAVRLLEVV